MTAYLDHTAIAQKLLNQQGEINDLRASLARVQAEISHISQLPALEDDGRPDSFATGARWTLRLIHNAITGTTETPKEPTR